MVRLEDMNLNTVLGIGEDEQPKEIGTRSLVLNFIRQYPEGVTSKMVSDFLEISQNRSRDILEELVLIREVYKRKLPGNNAYIYYPNGKLIHKYLQESKDIGDQIFRLSFHEGKRSPRLQIQERKFTLLEGEKVEGSIFIDVENIQEFIEFLDQLVSTFNNFVEENKNENA